MKSPYEAIPTGPNVLTVKMDCDGRNGWERWFLLQADEHQDNPHCRRDLLKRHHDQAVERDAGILKAGDTFCAMQGKYDKRSDKSDVRPEHQSGKYLDRLVDTAADFYEPYAHRILAFGDGNHEISIRERHETDLLERLVATLRARTGASIQHGGYTGWVRFMFARGAQQCSRNLWYMHGYGGGGPVTMDVIQGQRQAVYIENADVMLSGHTHDAWCAERVRLKLNAAGNVERRTVWQLKTPTYKEEYEDGRGGWHVNTGKPPKPLGAWWLRWYWEDGGVRSQVIRAD